MQLALGQLEASMRITPSKPLSVEEFWHFGFQNPDLRMEREPNGDIVVMTPTTRRTGFRNQDISRQLGNWAEQDGRGFAFDSNTGFTLPDTSVRSPDASWVSRERWNPEDDDDFAAVLCPEFVIELRSKSDRLGPAQEKMQSGIANGVELGWLIDPERRIVEVYRRGASQPDILDNVPAVYGEAPVGGFILELRRIWGV